MAQMRNGHRPFERVHGTIAFQVQYNRFRLFTIHRIISKHFQSSFTSLLSCAGARLATFPILPAVERGRGAAANVSFRSDNPSFAPLLHNSFLPIRTSPRPREILPAAPVPRRALGACARVFPPTSPG